MAELSAKILEAQKRAVDKFVADTKMKEMRVRLTFVSEVLGMQPNDKDIHSKFISSKAEDAMTREEEVAAIGAEEVEMKEMTVFYRKAGVPCMKDYQIIGMFKDNCGKASRIAGSKSKKFSAYKKKINGGIKIKEEWLPFNLSGSIGNCQRALRGQTPQGETNALANSETVPEGSTLDFTVLYEKEYYDVICEWLDGLIVYGFGGWRNGGKGRCLWSQLDESGKIIGGNLTD